MQLESKGGPRVLHSARSAANDGNIPYVMGSGSGAHLSNANDEETKREEPSQKRFVREKVFNREERYRMLTYIFEHLKTDDYVSVNTVFEQYEKQNMGFVINQD